MNSCKVCRLVISKENAAGSGLCDVCHNNAKLGSRFIDAHPIKNESSAIEHSHYTDLAISPLEYITANEGEFSWCIANTIKYVSRYKRKNGIEDLRKAAWYLNRQIELEEAKLED